MDSTERVVSLNEMGQGSSVDSHLTDSVETIILMIQLHVFLENSYFRLKSRFFSI